jgi:hypothetical protein
MTYFSSSKIDINDHTIYEDHIISDNYKELVCLICHGIAINPKFCSNCEKIFCTRCLDKHSEFSLKCPHCQKSPLEKKELSRIVKNILNSLHIKCPVDCGTSFKYEGLENHLSKCQLLPKTFNCINCKTEIKATGFDDPVILDHFDSCKKGCKYCKMELTSQISKHEFECFQKLIPLIDFIKEKLEEEFLKKNV